MGKLTKSILFYLLTCFFTCYASAQVDFKLDQKDDGSFVVKFVPNVNWEDKQSITVTAQVTVVVSPEMKFNSMESLAGIWQNTGTFKTPEENLNANYIVFGLQSLATDQIQYKKGEEIEVFAFSTDGPCSSSVHLMENNDPFMAPNSHQVNVGNQVTTFGSGNINAFKSTIDNIKCP